MIEEIKQKIFSTPGFVQLTSGEPVSGRPIWLKGIAGSLRAFVAAHLYAEFQGQLLVVCAEKDDAEKLRDDCAMLAGDADVRLYLVESAHDAQVLNMSAPISQVETLKALSANMPGIYITHASALAFGVPGKKEFKDAVIELALRSETPFQAFLDKLALLGFERKQVVETYGDFAVRGGIIDVFPFIGDNPVRIEFWGDTVESIREFDVLSQRSVRDLQGVSIIPDLSRIKSSGASNKTEEEDLTTQRQMPAGPAQGERHEFFSYLSSGITILADDPALIEKELTELDDEGVPLEFSYDEISASISRHPVYYFSVLSQADETTIDFASSHQPAVNGSVKALIEAVSALHQKGYEIVLASETKEETERIRELIEEAHAGSRRAPKKRRSERFDDDDVLPEEPRAEEEDESQQQELATEDEIDLDALLQEAEEEKAGAAALPAVRAIRYITEAMHAGFVYPEAKLAFFVEHEIFGRIKRRGLAKRRRFKGISQKELQTLRRGDYVVHVDHGIGKFLGLQKINVGGVEQEVAKLEYAEGGTLFVNLNFITRLQKYSSSEGHVPKMNRLGSADWERLKTRTKKKIKDIARDLILLYAKRKNEPGFAFQSDTHWQKEMEASFMYDDTADQARATGEVKADMESVHPMDRLVCGDVGFGKTEVAVRAAFKAVMNNKQVAILVPTTILAQQHFNTFTDRLNRYPIRIGLLSRFRTPKEQKSTLASLKQGTIDILIGTHRILSKDIAFKDLGLLIVDEEQRFGVAAKEKLRAMKISVDTLTLTATPIPRTLNFSLMGARDLSLINTPPRNRLPIQTEIAAFDKRIIRESVLKELHRGGQVFIVNDRIHSIDALTEVFQEFIPEARFHVAHGQMHAHQLEKVMMDFLQKKFDVLVTTKIIESGVDIPSVNTIIINRADHFGLAELYQLRGRVGRSNVQAYAYLLVPPIATLPKQTLRRLQAIEEFTELGSGFNLAMRDLEIRGAGNMLGAEQSGFIMEMGFEMYTRILEEAVAELKEQEFSALFAHEPAQKKAGEAQIEADIEAYIPDIYVENDSERLDIYRRLYRASTIREADDIRLELVDRFGAAMPEVDNLFALAQLRVLAADAGLKKVEINQRTLRLYLPGEKENAFYESGRFQAMMDKASAAPQYAITLKQAEKSLYLTVLLKNRTGIERIAEARAVLTHLQ
ncbi:MAG TPA: transcription-repair coupling factor [Bacteroidota bacterium]|nr:transcription-repair coupling factor [Bacteroidota bacterium]